MTKPSTPFSNGTEYENFLYNFCERCKHYKLRDDMFPEFPENGGCPILDAMENARFDIKQFPSAEVRELEDSATLERIAWHCCMKFEANDPDVQKKYINMLKRCK